MEYEYQPVFETHRMIHGICYERKDATHPWRERMGKGNGGYAIPKFAPWFEKTPKLIFEEMGIKCDAKRAVDLVNLFDGDLNGFYYVAEASPVDSEEAIIWILGGLAEYINEHKLSFKNINGILPADYLRTFCEYKIAKKFPSNFSKEIFIELLHADRFVNPTEEYIYIDTLTNRHISSMDWEEYEILVDTGNIDPKGFVMTGSMERLMASDVLDAIIVNDKYKMIDESEIDIIINNLIVMHPKQTEEAKKNDRAIQFFMGQVMKATKGKVTPTIVQTKLRKKFSNLA